MTCTLNTSTLSWSAPTKYSGAIPTSTDSKTMNEQSAGSLCHLRKLVGLVAPYRPIRTALAGKKLQVWTGYQPLDALMHAVWLAGVLATRGDDSLANIGVEALGL